MCGFFGIVYEQDKDNLGSILVRAGKRLSYRGYDASGVVGIGSDCSFDLRKDKGRIEEVEERLHLSEVKGSRGIIQLRWATYGIPSKENAQPHYDCTKRVFSAHNGNILNTPELREKLINDNHTLQGENDGEVIPHLIEDGLAEGKSFTDAVMGCVRSLNGDYAFVTTSLDEDGMWVVKKGSSLFLGIGKGSVCVSSDLTAILDNTREIVTLRDNELIHFTNSGFTVEDIETGEIVNRETKRITLSVEEVEKGSFEHFMLKEIYETPAKARSHLRLLKNHPSYEEAAKLISQAQRIFITGAGTSYHASLLGKYYCAEIAGVLLNNSFASEFSSLYSNILKQGDVLIVVSQSGETKDVKNVLNEFRDKGGDKVIGMVNNIGSTIALHSDIVLPINSQLEVSVPATKTFTNQALSFLYLANKVAELKGKVSQELDFSFIEGMIQDSIEKGEKEVSRLLDQLTGRKEFYILGFGLTYPAALEASLKIKEVVYMHIEGMYSGEFKHGPLSIVEQGYPVIFITTAEDKHFVLSHINEVKTRNGFIITIAPLDEELSLASDIFIPLPVSNPYLVPISATIYAQILSYRMSVSLGINPDFPRNISKTITVD